MFGELFLQEETDAGFIINNKDRNNKDKDFCNNEDSSIFNFNNKNNNEDISKFGSLLQTPAIVTNTKTKTTAIRNNHNASDNSNNNSNNEDQ